jgi:ATP-dependent exoDNAse (exonuclease V) beta subunit
MEPPGFDRFKHRSDQVEREERIRLLYVAMTRARDRVVLMGAWPAELRGARQARCILDLWQQAASQGTHPGGPTEAVSGAVEDAEGRRWVYLGCQTPEALATVADEGHVARPIGQVLPWAEVPTRSAREWVQGPSSQGQKDTVSSKGGGLGRDEAMDAGTVVHGIMELIAGDPDPKAALEALRADPRRWPIPSERGPIEESVIGRVEDVLDALRGGALIGVLARAEVLGCEVPMLLAGGEDGPVGAWSGAIDMLYRCPDDGEIVVVDHKTDTGLSDVEQGARAYAAQGAVYVTAVQQALDLPRPPRFEVWMLAEDQRVVVPTG